MEHLRQAKSLDEAIRVLRFKDLRIGKPFIGPKNKIELRRNSCEQGLCFRAEISIIEKASGARILTLFWNRKEQKWDFDPEKDNPIVAKWKDLW